QKVLSASRDQTIVVDFWAPWCAPCHMLASILEKVTGELQPRVALVKVNVDANPDVAASYGIRGIPTVKIFRNGEEVDGFVGVLPESEVRRIVRRHVELESDRLAATAAGLIGQGRLEEARSLLEEALREEPDFPAALLQLARLEEKAGNPDRARSFLERIPRVSEVWPEAEQLLARISLRESGDAGGDAGDLEQEAERKGTAESWYRAGCARAARGEYREALGDLLRSVEADPHWNEDAARKKMLEIFRVVGVRSALADEYRDRLQHLLY
ncbi:MAG TPA: thioredoxin, partial [Kiritimatiellae bacterium]|nr:thioredoxin [Kiritimatiellia bacterium]